MGYHIVWKQVKVPAIAKDGGTGSWREAKKIVRQWYIDEARKLRSVTEKDYFKPVAPPIDFDGKDQLDSLAQV